MKTTTSAATASLPVGSTEITGSIGRVIFAPDDGSDYCVIALSDGTSVVCCFSASVFRTGLMYRFMGRWVESRYGQQFEAQTFTLAQPAFQSAIIAYLKEFAPGVGAKTAQALYDHFGAQAVETLRDRPNDVVMAGLLNADDAHASAHALTAIAAHEATRLELYGLFKGRGFPSKLVNQVIAKWGAAAGARIRRNPYALLVGKFVGCGFKRCDQLWLDLEKPKAALKRQMVSAWNALRGCRDGHTWWPASRLATVIEESITGRIDVERAFKMGVRSGWLSKREEATGEAWYAEGGRAAAERRIADAITDLRRGPLRWPTSLPVSQIEGDGLPSDHQRELALRAMSTPVGILAGTPGTGKSHVLAFILREIIRTSGLASVAVCAPTGKAAVRATAAIQRLGIGITATTIHRLLKVGKNGHGTDDWGFEHNRDNPLKQRYIIVDESSMIDIGLLASLLDACQPPKALPGAHILFVGDPYQLPPVGHGAPLRDLITSGVVGYGELTEVRRNAGMLVEACRRIKAGEGFETVTAVDLDAEVPRNLRMVECRSEKQAIDALEGILTSMKKFDPVWQTQVITPLNAKSGVARKIVNQRLQGVLNPLGKRAAGNTFRVGDKIICLKNSLSPTVALNGKKMGWLANAEATRVGSIGAVIQSGPRPIDDPASYVAVREPGTTDPATLYVANGEIGRVIAVSASLTIARFGDGDGGALIKIPMGKSKDNGDSDAGSESGAGCNFDLAYAITVHKAQGSESPCVVFMIDEAAGMLASRELIYTAISRASKLCVLIGREGVLKLQARKASLVKRKTFLSELLQQGATHGDEKKE